MNKIAIIGSANALKPKIIVETLLEMGALQNKELISFTEKEEGIFFEFCKEKGIKTTIFQNEKLDDDTSIHLAKQQEADLLVSAGWPYKIPLAFLQSFKYTPINCHGSVLPDYRGNRAYMHYWANCESYYGATIHYMNERFDDGNIIVQGRLKLFMEETPSMLHRRTAELCAHLIPTAIFLVESGYKGRQVDGLKRYFNKLSPEEFEQYRKYNEKRNPSARKFTPHKIINFKK
ncbi:MAG TPA: formyltransferase family protein [Chondromyces sp.]|nr:formyltransferase family protein [Chondromyces sp.]